MKAEESNHYPDKAPMHTVISRMLNQIAPSVQRNRNEIINDVSRDLHTGTDTSMLVSTLTALVNAVISGTKNTSIRISAQKHQDLILLHISRNGSFNFNAVSESLCKVQPLAERMNGYIGITTYVDNTTTIAFSFSNIFRKS